MREKISLQKQVQNSLDDILAIGQSKHEAKRLGVENQKIYSWETYRSYLKQASYFAKWVKAQPVDPAVGHKPRTLEEARPYVERWLQSNLDRGLSNYTLKLQAAALAKVYRCKITDFDIDTPSRKRAEITRSRGAKARDAHFNEALHADLVTFCRCTGLRRAELEQIRGEDLVFKNGFPFLNVSKGTKGGRPRLSPIIGSEEEVKNVLDQLERAGKERVHPKPSEHADIHGYRSQYGTRVYEAFKRDLSAFKNERLIIYKNHVIEVYNASNSHSKDRQTFSRYYSATEKDAYGYPKMLPGYKDVSSVYVCRKDLATVVYDRRALFEASNALGHNREDVVAGHYIRASE